VNKNDEEKIFSFVLPLAKTRVAKANPNEVKFIYFALLFQM
jgi:hypothetical protein